MPLNVIFTRAAHRQIHEDDCAPFFKKRLHTQACNHMETWNISPINSWWRSSLAVALSSGFLTKHRLTKSMNSDDHWSGSRNEGGGFVGIMKMALIGWISPYGGLPSAISRAVMPRLQMSATQSYPISWITSGAIQNGVPMTVFLLAMVSYNTATPILYVCHILTNYGWSQF